MVYDRFQPRPVQDRSTRGRPRVGARTGWQERRDVPARPSFALPRLHRLLYLRRPWQIFKISNDPAYGTLPGTSHRLHKTSIPAYGALSIPRPTFISEGKNVAGRYSTVTGRWSEASLVSAVSRT